MSNGHYTILVDIYTEELLIVPSQDLYFQRSLYNISGYAQKNYTQKNY